MSRGLNGFSSLPFFSSSLRHIKKVNFREDEPPNKVRNSGAQCVAPNEEMEGNLVRALMGQNTFRINLSATRDIS